MITNRNDLIEYLNADKKALNRNSSNPKLMDYIWRYEILLRKCEYYNNCKKGLFNKVILKVYNYRRLRIALLCGFEIPLNCFDKGLSIAHKGTIIVNEAARIGENCRLHVGVNIGTQAGYGDKAPCIGDNVYIAPGAKLFGSINIAEGIVIGANAVVNKSFDEANISIGGVPAKKISDKGTFGLKAM